MGITGMKRCLSIFAWMSVLLLFASSAWGACSGERIGYETQQMLVGASQALTVVGARPDAVYRWRVASGGGTLSSTTGTSVVYTAPSSNPNCENNPAISLSSDGAVCNTLQIAVSAPRIDGGAFFEARTFSKTACTHSIYKRHTTVMVLLHRNGRRATAATAIRDGRRPATATGLFFVRLIMSTPAAPQTPPAVPWNGVTIACGGFTDIRTAAQKAKGCCPAGAPAGRASAPACDVAVTSFGGTSTASTSRTAAGDLLRDDRLVGSRLLDGDRGGEENRGGERPHRVGPLGRPAGTARSRRSARPIR